MSTLTWPDFSKNYSQIAKEQGRTVTRAQISTAWRQYKETGNIPSLSPKKVPIKKIKKRSTKKKAKPAKKIATKKRPDSNVIYVLYRNEEEDLNITTTTIIGAYRNREDARKHMKIQSEAELEEIGDVEHNETGENDVFFTINGERDVYYQISEVTLQ